MTNLLRINKLNKRNLVSIQHLLNPYKEQKCLFIGGTGERRSGKSLFQSCLLTSFRSTEELSQIFKTAKGDDSVTKGLQIYQKPIKISLDGETYNIFIIDSQGLDSLEGLGQHDESILCFLLSFCDLTLYHYVLTFGKPFENLPKKSNRGLVVVGRDRPTDQYVYGEFSPEFKEKEIKMMGPMPLNLEMEFVPFPEPNDKIRNGDSAQTLGESFNKAMSTFKNQLLEFVKHFKENAVLEDDMCRYYQTTRKLINVITKFNFRDEFNRKSLNSKMDLHYEQIHEENQSKLNDFKTICNYLEEYNKEFIKLITDDKVTDEKYFFKCLERFLETNEKHFELLELLEKTHSEATKKFFISCDNLKFDKDIEETKSVKFSEIWSQSKPTDEKEESSKNVTVGLAAAGGVTVGAGAGALAIAGGTAAAEITAGGGAVLAVEGAVVGGTAVAASVSIITGGVVLAVGAVLGVAALGHYAYTNHCAVTKSKEKMRIKLENERSTRLSRLACLHEKQKPHNYLKNISLTCEYVECRNYLDSINFGDILEDENNRQENLISIFKTFIQKV
ncbi:DgyrCDS14882 [Dimorphilus gyrociliatus]|uniref:DgyrCDS14882 n=1 Tax=Dimorphilus gyrociliatus TaxID=2664684 RepID=A0A7I8WFC4_9ANNE|nr:DgyrCDS14882 [Dimorphilus gyrociliatus]